VSAPAAQSLPLPLDGRRILVTRARHQAGQLAQILRARGAAVLDVPAIEIAPPQSCGPLDRALNNLSQYQWLIVTSANAVDALRARMEALGLPASSCAHLRIAAIGSATAQALLALGLPPAITPPEYVAESLVKAIGAQTRGQRVLLARAAVARDVIPGTLRAQGARIDVVDAYRTAIPTDSVTAIRTLFSSGDAPDAVTFTSSSTVVNFLALLHQAGVAAPASLRAVSIGPITSRTLREHGWEPAAEAHPHDLAGLVEAVVRACSPHSGGC
jgi:uroporphyrinogen-III synthase